MGWSVLLALLIVAPQARAAASHKPKLMLMDIPPDPRLQPGAIKAMDDFIAGALRDQGFVVMTPSDIGAVLGMERQRQLMGCSETSCIADIGGALGVDYIVRSTVVVLGKSTAVTLVMLDKRGVAANQVRELADSNDPSDLIRLLEKMVPRLVAPVPRTPDAQAKAPPPEKKAEPKPEPEHKPDLTPHEASETAAAPAGGLESSQAASSGGGGKIAGYTLIGVGAAAGVASAVFGVMATSKTNQMKDVVAGKSAGNVQSLHDDAQKDAMISTVALGAAVASGVAGIIVVLASGGESESSGSGASAP